MRPREGHPTLNPASYPDAFMYVFGNAGTHETFHANRKELNKWKVIPRQLRDVTHRSIEVGLSPFTIRTHYSSLCFCIRITWH